MAVKFAAGLAEGELPVDRGAGSILPGHAGGDVGREFVLGCIGLNHGYGPATEVAEATTLIRAALAGGTKACDEANKQLQLVDEALAPVRDPAVVATKFGFEEGGANAETQSRGNCRGSAF